MMLIKANVGPSTIHGLGLFAADFIASGTPIWCFQPGFDHDFSPAQFVALPPLAREHTRWFCFVRQRPTTLDSLCAGSGFELALLLFALGATRER